MKTSDFDYELPRNLIAPAAELSAADLEDLARWCYVSGKLVMTEERAKEFGEAVSKIRT